MVNCKQQAIRLAKCATENRNAVTEQPNAICSIHIWNMMAENITENKNENVSAHNVDAEMWMIIRTSGDGGGGGGGGGAVLTSINIMNNNLSARDYAMFVVSSLCVSLSFRHALTQTHVAALPMARAVAEIECKKNIGYRRRA